MASLFFKAIQGNPCHIVPLSAKEKAELSEDFVVHPLRPPAKPEDLLFPFFQSEYGTVSGQRSFHMPEEKAALLALFHTVQSCGTSLTSLEESDVERQFAAFDGTSCHVTCFSGASEQILLQVQGLPLSASTNWILYLLFPMILVSKILLNGFLFCRLSFVQKETG